jgi:SPP1 gp7 family putative phage head morphogenesis protein
LNLDSWVKLVGTFESDLSAVAVESSKRALAELDINDSDLFDLLQTEAMEWARDRAAEMVGMQYNDSGKLVPNPNARWAITDSTRDGLRTLITNAYAEGIDVTQLAQQIQDSYLFSASRAMTIARTELAKADGESTLRSWKESGRVSGKQWLLGSEHDDNNPDECDDNADQGVIDLEDDFDSGDEAPPAHPNCVCAVITEILAEQGEVDDPGAE